MATTPDPMPQPKVVAGGVTGAVSVLLVYIAGLLGLELPAEVAVAGATLLSFIASYYTPNK